MRFQVETFAEYTDVKRKLLSRTPGLRGSLATTARAELPRPMAPGEAPPTPAPAHADWHDDLLADSTDM
jgi:hypothetical protein